MADSTQVVSSIEDVRAYITETFCSLFDLDQRFFVLREFAIYRRGRPTGTYFVLEGPRRLRFTAVWDHEDGVLLFYGMNGQRIQMTELIYADLASAQAA